jgi:hypothetical protein
MEQRIDLDGVTLEKSGDMLTVTHHKTGTVHKIEQSALVRWIMRKLRELF